MSTKNVNIRLGLPGGGISLLTITFVVLKALGYLDWSWVWVFSPLWITASVVVGVLSIVLLALYVEWWWGEPWKTR